MADETQERLAQVILDAAREGFAMPSEAITWALQVTGDVQGSGMATPELWSFLKALQQSAA
jgi:hypothetical protein